MTAKRILCLFFALLLCLTSFTACGGDKTPSGDGTGTGNNSETESTPNEDDVDDGSDTGEQTTVDDRYVSDLKQNYDFGGPQEFVILTREDTEYEYVSDGMDGDTVSAAVFERNEEVMERCNIEFNILTQPGDWNNRDSFMTTVRNNALAPISEYDLISTHMPYLMVLAMEGVGYDLTDVPAIDLTKRWWSEPFYNESNYKGSIYTMIGDIGYTVYEYIQVIFFNEKLADDYELGDLYDLALDGDWTWALFKEYVTKVTTDLDVSADERNYGYLSTGQCERNLTIAFDTEIAQWSEADQIYKIPLFLGDPTLSIVQDISSFIIDTPQVRHGTSTAVISQAEEYNPIFMGDRALFYGHTLMQAVTFKLEMESDYGILPMPKYTEDQIDYRCSIDDNLNAILVPTTVKNVEMTGVVAEMMSSVGYATITQEYYEETLKYQAFNDPDCVDTLELIRTSLVIPFSFAYSYPLGTIHSLVSNYIAGNGAGMSISTFYTQSSKKWQTALDELYADLEALESASGTN